MPKRSLHSSVLKWPERESVRAQLVARAHEIAQQDLTVQKIGYIGSLAHGEWGVGSDADIIVVVSALGAAAARLARFDFTSLPVPADVLVYTEEEFVRLQAAGTRFAHELERAQWAYVRAPL